MNHLFTKNQYYSNYYLNPGNWLNNCNLKLGSRLVAQPYFCYIINLGFIYDIGIWLWISYGTSNS